MAEHCGQHGRITYSRDQLVMLRNSAGVKQSQSRLQFPDFVPSQKNDSSPSGSAEHVPVQKERDRQHSNTRGRGGRGDKGVQRFEHKQENVTVGKETEVGCNAPFTSFGREQVRGSTDDVYSRGRGERRGGRGSRGMFRGGGRRTFRLNTIMDIEDATELTLKLTIMNNELEEFLNSIHMSADDVETMMKVLVRDNGSFQLPPISPPGSRCATVENFR